MKQVLKFNTIQVVLYEIPEGSPRPRFRLVGRQNLANMAIANPNFVHVYSPTGAEDNMYMKRLMTDKDFTALNHVIYTPCIVKYDTYFKTPSSYNAIDTYLAELGVHNPISKPDWDNIGKKYSDMSNSNLWIDDRICISGTVNKWYSVLPRVEIRIDYLNMLTTHKQYNSISNAYDGDIRYFGDGRDF
jgi:Holliday junction resolvase RusA-like endonuclease